MKTRKYFYVFLSVLTMVCLLAGCHSKTGSGNIQGGAGGGGLKPVGSDVEQEETNELEKVYILKEVNLTEQIVVLLKVGGSYREYTYKYTGGTVMMDRYEKNILAESLVCGEVFTIELNEAGDTLKSLKESKQVWTHEDVKSFTLDLENEIMKINGENYHLSDTTMVFSQDGLISRFQLSEKDSISIIGFEKELLSVIVNTGHGTLAFSNVDQFKGGYFVLGNIMAGEITEDMQVEVPAGAYALSVAYKGNGGNTTIEILPGETTVVDLKPFEAAAKKTSQVLIKPAQEGMIIKINGEEVDTSQPFTLEYGMYRITATLEGYDTWSRLLLISSPKAEFVIDMEVPSGSDTEDEDNDDDEDDETDDSDEDQEDDGDDSSDSGVSDNLIDDVLDIIIGGGN